ncbi:MAG: hypothetical protein U0234_18000 [Sandaracinus sp.]
MSDDGAPPSTSREPSRSKTPSYVGLAPIDAARTASEWLARLPWDDTGESLETMAASRLLRLL